MVLTFKITTMSDLPVFGSFVVRFKQSIIQLAQYLLRRRPCCPASFKFMFQKIGDRATLGMLPHFAMGRLYDCGSE